MKRYVKQLSAFFIILSAAFCSYGQEAAESEKASGRTVSAVFPDDEDDSEELETGGGFVTEEAEEETKKEGKEFRIGVFGACTPVLGQMNQTLFGNAGGGISLEYDFIKIVGLGINAGGNFNPVKTEKLASCWNIEASALVYARIPLIKDTLFIQPEISYGVLIFFPTKAEGYEGELSACYADQFVQLGASLRFSPAALASGSLEFELCPLYRFSPENGVMNHYIGGKIGVQFRINNHRTIKEEDSEITEPKA